MTINEIYAQYQVMPTLADHMYLVAAVAKIYTDQITDPDFPRNEIISACLLHDIGNIVKFNLDNVPPGLDIPNINHWKEVQKEVRGKYGIDEHDVTATIACEIGLSPVTMNALENCGTKKAKQVLESKNIPAMFVTFCDYHVAPAKIVTPRQRLDDILERYTGHPKHDGYVRDGENVMELYSYLITKYNLDTSAITDKSVRKITQNIKDYIVK